MRAAVVGRLSAARVSRVAGARASSSVAAGRPASYLDVGGAGDSSAGGARPMQVLGRTSLGMPPGKSRQSLLRSESVSSGWLAGREHRKRVEQAEEAEAALARRLLLRGHVERWLGRMRLPSDPVMLRALARGDGWVCLDSLCTQPKLRLLKATPAEVAAALESSRVVEVKRRAHADPSLSVGRALGVGPSQDASKQPFEHPGVAQTRSGQGVASPSADVGGSLFVRPHSVTLPLLLKHLREDRVQRRGDLKDRVCPASPDALPRYGSDARVRVSRTVQEMDQAVRAVLMELLAEGAAVAGVGAAEAGAAGAGARVGAAKARAGAVPAATAETGARAAAGAVPPPGGLALGMCIDWPDRSSHLPSTIRLATPTQVQILRFGWKGSFMEAHPAGGGRARTVGGAGALGHASAAPKQAYPVSVGYGGGLGEARGRMGEARGGMGGSGRLGVGRGSGYEAGMPGYESGMLALAGGSRGREARDGGVDGGASLVRKQNSSACSVDRAAHPSSAPPLSDLPPSSSADLPPSLVHLLSRADIVKVGFGVEQALRRLGGDVAAEHEERGRATGEAVGGGKVAGRRAAWAPRSVVDIGELARRGVLLNLEGQPNVPNQEGQRHALNLERKPHVPNREGQPNAPNLDRQFHAAKPGRRQDGSQGRGPASLWQLTERYLGCAAPDDAPSQWQEQRAPGLGGDAAGWGGDTGGEDGSRLGEVDASALQDKLKALHYTGKQVRQAPPTRPAPPPFRFPHPLPDLSVFWLLCALAAPRRAPFMP